MNALQIVIRGALCRVKHAVQAEGGLRNGPYVFQVGLTLFPLRVEGVLQLMDLGVLAVQPVPEALIPLLRLAELFLQLPHLLAQPLGLLGLFQQQLQQLPPSQLLKFSIRHGVGSPLSVSSASRAAHKASARQRASKNEYPPRCFGFRYSSKLRPMSNKHLGRKTATVEGSRWDSHAHEYTGSFHAEPVCAAADGRDNFCPMPAFQGRMVFLNKNIGRMLLLSPNRPNRRFTAFPACYS